MPVLDVVQLDRVRVVPSTFLSSVSSFGVRFDLASRSPTSVRVREDLLEVVVVVLVRDDCDVLGHERGEPARVVEVRVRVDDVADRLVGDDALRLGDDREAARFALPALEHDDVILEFDRERHVAAGDAVDAVGQLLRLNRRRWRRAARRRGWCAGRWRRRRHQLREVRWIGHGARNHRLQRGQARPLLRSGRDLHTKSR